MCLALVMQDLGALSEMTAAPLCDTSPREAAPSVPQVGQAICWRCLSPLTMAGG